MSDNLDKALGALDNQLAKPRFPLSIHDFTFNSNDELREYLDNLKEERMYMLMEIDRKINEVLALFQD